MAIKTCLPKWAKYDMVEWGSCHVVKVSENDHGVLCENLQSLIATGTKSECEEYIK